MNRLVLKAEKNTTFNERLFHVSTNGMPIDLTDWIIEMQLKETFESEPINIGISITDPTNGYFKINTFVPDYFGNYIFDIKMIDSNGKIVRYIKGNFIISNTVTDGN